MPSVFLAPSFQEKNIGAGSYGNEEFRMNQVVNVVEEIIKYNVIKVVRNDPSKDFSGNIALSNSSKCDIHLSLRSNVGDGGKGKGKFNFLQARRSSIRKACKSYLCQN